MAHTNDNRDPARVVEVGTVIGRNNWQRRLLSIFAGHDAENAEPVLTTDRQLHMGPPPGRVPRLLYQADGGNPYPNTRSWPPFLDVAYIPHVPIIRIPQRAVPRTWADNNVQIPAVYVGNPV